MISWVTESLEFPYILNLAGIMIRKQGEDIYRFLGHDIYLCIYDIYLPLFVLITGSSIIKDRSAIEDYSTLPDEGSL
jgi:hypothetical protein